MENTVHIGQVWKVHTNFTDQLASGRRKYFVRSPSGPHKGHEERVVRFTVKVDRTVMVVFRRRFVVGGWEGRWSRPLSVPLSAFRKWAEGGVVTGIRAPAPKPKRQVASRLVADAVAPTLT